MLCPGNIFSSLIVGILDQEHMCFVICLPGVMSSMPWGWMPGANTNMHLGLHQQGQGLAEVA